MRKQFPVTPGIRDPSEESLAELRKILDRRSPTPLTDAELRESARNLLGFGMALVEIARDRDVAARRREEPAQENQEADPE